METTENLIIIGDHQFRQILDVRAQTRVFTNTQVTSVLWVQ